MRLVIGVPSYDGWASEFGQALALTMADLAANPGDMTSMRLVRSESTIISEGRTDLVKDAQQNEATHLLWCDADMVFRPSNVRALMAHDVDIVGCTYKKRRPPHDMTAQDMDGKRIDAGAGDLIEAAHCGFGLVLTRMSVFETLPEPWFAFPWIEEVGRFLGEDVFFCRKARAHDIKIHIDPAASIGVGHVGKAVY